VGRLRLKRTTDKIVAEMIAPPGREPRIFKSLRMPLLRRQEKASCRGWSRRLHR
jgi:hypothetical protein